MYNTNCIIQFFPNVISYYDNDWRRQTESFEIRQVDVFQNFHFVEGGGAGVNVFTIARMTELANDVKIKIVFYADCYGEFIIYRGYYSWS